MGKRRDLLPHPFDSRPEQFTPCVCNLCDKCWFNLATGHCVFGGPFTHYRMPDGTNKIPMKECRDENSNTEDIPDCSD